MSKNFIGVILTVCLVLAGFIVMPIYYMAQIDMARAQEEILNEVQLFLDKVADTHEITELDLEDFTLAMAGTSVPVTFEITKEKRQVNPNPAASGDEKPTHTTWVTDDDIYRYDDGDLIFVEIKQVGENFYQSFASRALGMYTPKVEFRLGRMVR